MLPITVITAVIIMLLSAPHMGKKAAAVVLLSEPVDRGGLEASAVLQ